MSEIDEKLLYIKFTTLAEKCDTLEKMTIFCNSFLKKHSKNVDSTPKIEDYYQNQILKPSYCSHQIERISASYEIPEFLLVDEVARYAKKSIANSIMDQILSKQYVEILTHKNYSRDTKVITGTVYVTRNSK